MRAPSAELTLGPDGTAVRAPHAVPAEEVEAGWRTDPADGLTDLEAARRRERFGPNTVPSPPRRGAWRRLLDQFRNGMVALLAVAATVSLMISEPLDAVVIGAIVVAIAALGFWQEGKAASAADAVRALLSPVASVLRDGAVRR